MVWNVKLKASQHGARQGIQNNTPTARLATAATSWHFPTLPETSGTVRLMLFNPHSFMVTVWIHMAGDSVADLKHVVLAAHGTKVIQLASLAPGHAKAALSLRADQAIVPLRLIAGPGAVQSGFGLPGLGTAATKILPARLWYFPALSPTAGVVLLTLYNPNSFAVDATVRVAGGSGADRMRVHVAAQNDTTISLSASAAGDATQALAVSASGDIVPQRAVIGQAASRST